MKSKKKPAKKAKTKKNSKVKAKTKPKVKEPKKAKMEFFDGSGGNYTYSIVFDGSKFGQQLDETVVKHNENPVEHSPGTFPIPERPSILGRPEPLPLSSQGTSSYGVVFKYSSLFTLIKKIWNYFFKRN